jgi:hypothetical protein
MRERSSVVGHRSPSVALLFFFRGNRPKTINLLMPKTYTIASKNEMGGSTVPSFSRVISHNNTKNSS